jgi:hypothetical protein
MSTFTSSLIFVHLTAHARKFTDPDREKSSAKARPDGRHFLKILYENDLKIKNKPDLDRVWHRYFFQVR